MKPIAAFAVFALSASVVFAQTSAPQVPGLSPDEQKMVGAQLASPKLDDRAYVASIQLKATPLRQILDAIGTAAGITVRYESGVGKLDSPADAALTSVTADDAFRRVLEPQGLTYKPTSAKSVFIYADTPANREKYTESVRTFSIVNADMAQLTQTINRALPGSSEGPRPALVTLKDSRKIVVRATPDKMAEIAKVIAATDKK